MPKFRKKPVVIDAFRWDGTNVQALADWAARADFDSRKQRGLPPPDDRHVDLPIHVTQLSPQHIQLEIDTLEGPMQAFAGDWIICGVAGEFYPCRSDIFAASYEAV